MNKQIVGKAVFICFFALLIFQNIFFLKAQQVKIGNNIMSFRASALLELEDTNRALLLTRVFNPNISIKNPYKGMITFDSTLNQLVYYNGTDWIYSGKSTNIYNSDGIIENTTAQTRTITRDGNSILFIDTSKRLQSPDLTLQMKTYDTIIFGKYGRVGIGTSNPQGKLDVRGPIYVYADRTNNKNFINRGSFYTSNDLPALVLQPDTTMVVRNPIFITMFNQKYPNVYPGNTAAVDLNSIVDGRTDIGFLAATNLFTIWNRSTTFAAGIALRVGETGQLKINQNGQLAVATNQYAADTAVLSLDANIPSSYADSIRNRYPLLINVSTGSNTAASGGGLSYTKISARSKYGILFTESLNSVSINNLVNNARYKLGFFWALNVETPVVGISTFFGNNNNMGFTISTFSDLPSSDLYDVVRFYIEQPRRGQVPGLPLNELSYQMQQGVSTIKLVNVAEQRYSKLAFSEADLASQWQLMKMGKNPSTSASFLPSFTSKNPNDFYIVKDSTDIWIQFQYAGNKISFIKDIEATVVTPSDRRIKKIKNKIVSQTALEKIKEINIVDYTMKKDTSKEKSIKRGVIAQELEKILPEAVTTSQTVSPLSASNIEEYAKSFFIDSSNKKEWYIDLTLVDHGLKKGDKLYLKYVGVLGDLAPIYLQEYVVDSLNKDHFKLPYSKELSNAKKIYIIGQEIKDMKTVDYNYLNMTNIVATQELSKQLDEANTKIKNLEADILELKNLVQQLGKNPN